MGDLSEHFSRQEFACKCGCGFDTVDYQLVKVLEYIRFICGEKNLFINSGCRCVEYNTRVDGSFNSLHLFGRAGDFIIKGILAEAVQRRVLVKYPDRYGIGSYVNFTHLDTRTIGPARWEG